jgi:hypothetical protein
MKLNDFKDVMDNAFGERHVNISDNWQDEVIEDKDNKWSGGKINTNKKLDRNTIIITALANYYDYNDLPKEEGREVIKIIKDIQKQNRDEKTK